MVVLNECNTGTLAPYVPGPDKPWGLKQVQHLFRRTGFGDQPQQYQNALSQGPEALVDAIVDEALSLPLPAEPDWSNETYDPINPPVDELIGKVVEWSYLSIEEMISNGFRDKMALFWSNHLVTKIEAYLCPNYLYWYHSLLLQHGLGNFKTMVEEVGKTPAMLIFLNNVQNFRGNINENYARELFELFTLGQDNGYTQQDIVEAARALTGFNGFNPQELCDQIGYVPALHDPGSKTIFGQTGNYDFQGLHDLLFDVRRDEIAEFICRKLYVEFIAPDVTEDIVQGLAQTFKDNNFDIAPVMRQLLKSEHFFHESVLGTKCKSPFENYLIMLKELGMPVNDMLAGINLSAIEIIYGVTTDQGQQLFNPPNVAGWPGDRAWIDATTIQARWEVNDLFAFNMYTRYPEQLREWARLLSNDSSDGRLVSDTVVDFLIPTGLQSEQDYAEAFEVFKGELPDNYFEDGTWSLDYNPDPAINIVPAQLALLIQHMSHLPEFQLF
jgi:uncharacterized protein (DUF1800 family)